MHGAGASVTRVQGAFPAHAPPGRAKTPMGLGLRCSAGKAASASSTAHGALRGRFRLRATRPLAHARRARALPRNAKMAARPACAASASAGRSRRGSACRARSRKGDRPIAGFATFCSLIRRRAGGRKGAGRAAGVVMDAPSPQDPLMHSSFGGVGIGRPWRGTQESRPTARSAARERPQIRGGVKRNESLRIALIENFSSCLVGGSAAAWRQTAFAA